MLRRHFIAAAAALAAVGFATTVRAQEGSGLPRTLGGLPQTGIQRAPTEIVIVTYEAPGAAAHVGIAPGIAGVHDGAEGDAMPSILRRLHRAATSERSDLQLTSENLVHRMGEPGREWTWRGNIYSFRSPTGSPGRRVLLVTGHRDRLVWLQLDFAITQDTFDLRPFMDEISAFLASARGAIDQRIAPGGGAKGRDDDRGAAANSSRNSPRAV